MKNAVVGIIAAAVVGACIGLQLDSLLNTGYTLRIVGAVVGLAAAVIIKKLKG